MADVTAAGPETFNAERPASTPTRRLVAASLVNVRDPDEAATGAGTGALGCR